MWVVQGKAAATLVAALAIAVSGVAKGVTGLGLPILATPIMAVLFGLKTGIAVGLVPALASDLMVLGLVWRQIRRRQLARALWLLVPALVGIAVGIRILARTNSPLLYAVLGIVVAGFVVTAGFRLLRKWHRPPPWAEPAVGLVAGIIQGLVGASGPIVSMYLYQLDLDRSDFLVTINSFFLVGDTMELVSAWQVGIATPYTMHFSFLALIPLAVGMAVAALLQRHVTPQLFQRGILALLTVSAATLLGKASGLPL